jgi:hypothetical protein
VHQPGHEPLQELPLAEHDHGLVADPAGEVVAPLDGLAGADEPRQEERAPREQAAGEGEQGREPDRAGGDGYVPPAFLSSAEIAGTISCRSPITA